MPDLRAQRIHKHHLRRTRKQRAKRHETFVKTYGNLATRQAKIKEAIQ